MGNLSYFNDDDAAEVRRPRVHISVSVFTEFDRTFLEKTCRSFPYTKK